MIKTLYKKILPERLRIQIRRKINQWKSQKYRGEERYCNCCGRSFKRFLPKADREDAECPYCGSLERTRLLIHYLEKETKIYTQKGIKVLHFGPEYLLDQKLAQIPGIHYIDADYHPAYARHVIDITDIPYPDDHFDLIICSHVLGYVVDEQKAMEELYRVLSPNGEAIILTYMDMQADDTKDEEWINTDELRRIHYGEAENLRLHGRNFGDILRKKGFEVKEIDYRMYFSAGDRRKESLGLGNRELIFLCKKLPNR